MSSSSCSLSGPVRKRNAIWPLADGTHQAVKTEFSTGVLAQFLNSKIVRVRVKDIKP